MASSTTPRLNSARGTGRPSALGDVDAVIGGLAGQILRLVGRQLDVQLVLHGRNLEVLGAGIEIAVADETGGHGNSGFVGGGDGNVERGRGLGERTSLYWRRSRPSTLTQTGVLGWPADHQQLGRIAGAIGSSCRE